MLQAVPVSVKEWVRCTRHNLLHLRTFRLSYQNQAWQVRDGGLSLTFPQYPFLAFHDIEGYLCEGRWRPQSGMTVVDAGGCYGEFSLYAAKCVGPSGKVLMLEPDLANIAVAKHFFEMNGNPGNIEIVPAGLWSKQGTLKFTAGQGALSSVASLSNSDVAAKVIEIQVHSLASLVKEFRLNRLDFVKMDIEGAEVEVISTAGELPTQYRPRYAIASYHVVEGKKAADTLEEVFPKIGYHCRTGYPKHLTTWASPLSSG